MIRKLVAYIRMRMLYIRARRNSRTVSKELVSCFLDADKSVRGFLLMRDFIDRIEKRIQQESE